jgi:hypothetical protein
MFSLGINVVSLAFLKPTEIMDPLTCATDTCTDKGVWVGMPGVVQYFKDEGMDLVFLSIRGETYTLFWEQVLIDNKMAQTFAAKVADIANELEVSIELITRNWLLGILLVSSILLRRITASSHTTTPIGLHSHS